MHKLLLLQVLLLTCADTQLSDIDCGCTGQLADAEKVDTNVFDSLGASYSAADAASDAQLDLQQLLHVKHSRLHTAGAIDPARPTRSACVIWPLLRSRLRSLLLVVDILLMMELLMLLPALRRLAHTRTPRPLVSHTRHRLCSLLGRGPAVPHSEGARACACAA